MRKIVLENSWFRAVILPDVGAKIYDLIWKPADRNLLWHNPRTAPQPYPIEAVFDNYWCGGWDDCFPTCDACIHGGEQYPSLGELRSLHWAVAAQNTLSADLSVCAPITPARVEKSVTLDAGAPVLRMRHRITSLGYKSFDFVWGTHPAWNVSPGDVLRVPATTGYVGEASCASLGVAGQRYDWPLMPVADGTVDMSRVPSASGEFCGHYAADLAAGWYALEDASTGSGVLMRFPVEICRVLWLWLNYGGYRGHYHVVLEPWTSRPVVLSDAVREGTSLRLEKGAVFEVEVAVTCYDPPETWRDALRRMEGDVAC